MPIAEPQTASQEGEPRPALEQLKLLADDTRWRLIQQLRRSDYQVGELVEQTGLAQNLISYHLNVLRQAGLVQVHRSDADARASYYGASLPGLAQIAEQLGVALGIPGAASPGPLAGRAVIFLCRANSARSQMAEGWLRALSGAQVIARSAGTHPAALHPLAVHVMAEAGVDIAYQQPKHVDALADLASAVVVTVCDIAREECAVWLRAARQLHWSIPDPAGVADEGGRLATFRAVRDELRTRVSGLLALLPSLIRPDDLRG